MNTGERVGNLTDWKRILVAGDSPGRREGASTAVDMSGGVVYLFGGRTTEKLVDARLSRVLILLRLCHYM